MESAGAGGRAESGGLRHSAPPLLSSRAAATAACCRGPSATVWGSRTPFQFISSRGRRRSPGRPPKSDGRSIKRRNSINWPIFESFRRPLCISERLLVLARPSSWFRGERAGLMF